MGIHTVLNVVTFIEGRVANILWSVVHPEHIIQNMLPYGYTAHLLTDRLTDRERETPRYRDRHTDTLTQTLTLIPVFY